MVRPDDDDIWWDAFVDRQRLRLLPARLRHQIGRVRNTYHRGAVLQTVTGWMNELAERQGVRQVTGEPEFPIRYVPAIHRGAIVRALLKDQTFVTHVRNEVDAVLAAANRDRVQAAVERGVPKLLPNCRPPKAGTWNCNADIGLGTATIFEAKPEAFVVGIAQRTWAQIDAAFGDDADLTTKTGVRVLDIGSFPGSTTLALAATMPADATLRTYEVDTVGEPTNLPYVKYSGQHLPETDKPFDLIVANIAPPTKDGLSQYRHRYKEVRNHRELGERRTFDFGNVGLKRWTRGLGWLLANLRGRLTETGELVLLVSTSVRVRNGYEPMDLDPTVIPEMLDLCGFDITHDLTVVETHRLPQPFVVEERPGRRCLIARPTVTS